MAHERVGLCYTLRGALPREGVFRPTLLPFRSGRRLPAGPWPACARSLACAMSSNAMRDARFCWAGRFCKRLWPFLVVKAASSAKIAPTQHNEGVNCDQLVGLLEPIAQPTHVFRPFFARSPKVLTQKFTWHPETSRCMRRTMRYFKKKRAKGPG